MAKDKEVQGPEIDDGLPEEKELPLYLRDEPPTGKTDYAKWGLVQGKSDEELLAEGVNPGTLRIAAQQLEKEGYRKRPPKLPRGKPAGSPTEKSLQVFAKGSPPEALIESMIIPFVDGQTQGFEHGMKFGASMVILGVRIAQELSNVAVQQARPLIEMVREARAGEAAAAKGAAGEAAMLAASAVGQQLQPYLANLGKTPEADPMKGMMTRVMEPVIQRMMNMFMPGMGGAPASGWTKKSE